MPTKPAVLLLLGILVSLDVLSLRHQTVTYDEPAHLRYGQNILNLDSTRFDDSKMPFSALNALPGALAARLPEGRVATALGGLGASRVITVLFSLLVALCVFQWTRELYGATAGLLALTLYTFDPNLLAHSQLVTTDLYATGMVTLSLYFFWRFLRHGGWGRAVVSGSVLGLAQLAKYTTVGLFPILALIAVGFFAVDIWRDIEGRRYRSLASRAGRFIGVTLLFVILSLVAINIGFLFKGTGTPLDGYTFRSEFFREIQASIGSARTIPLPLPYPYLEGLDWVVRNERNVAGYNYLLGEISSSRGFDGYYLYASLYKVPLGAQLVLLMAAVAYGMRWRSFDFFKNEWSLIGPVLFFTIYFNFFNRSQLGIRFFLVVFPLLYVFCGSLCQEWRQRSRWITPAVGVSIACQVLSVLSYYPHFLPYFNELVWDRRLAYKVLADSNLDWGQNRWYLDRYIASHPGAIVEPDGPTAGTIVVDANALTGVIGGPERFRWLREHLEPTDHVAYATLVFEVSDADLERIRSDR